jgi:glutamyl-tRNA reductase
MSVFALGLNHTTAPLDLRGRFAFSPQQLPAALQSFAPARPGERGRDRLHLQPDRALRRRRGAGLGPAVDWLAGVGGVPSQTLRSHAYVMEGASAARHAFASPAASIRWSSASRRSSAS